MSNKNGRWTKFMWPSQNIWTISIWFAAKSADFISGYRNMYGSFKKSQKLLNHQYIAILSGKSQEIANEYGQTF